MNGGYDSIYLGLVPRLVGCDWKASADRLGLEYVADGVQLDFLNRKYQITLDGVEPLDGRPVDANTKSVLLYYLLSRGTGAPENSYVPFESIPRKLTGLDFQNRLMSAPLEREFGNNYARFGQAAMKLGGIEEGTLPGKHAWRFDVLPKIPVKTVFYEADDDFPANIQIMLDKTAPEFLEFECLAFMVGCFVRALINTAKYGSVASKPGNGVSND
jgi:hypothetical protein